MPPPTIPYTQSCLINSVQRWLTSTLLPPLQTSCHIWCSAELANTHCGWANMAADLGSGQIALLGVFAMANQQRRTMAWVGWVDKYKF